MLHRTGEKSCHALVRPLSPLLKFPQGYECVLKGLLFFGRDGFEVDGREAFRDSY
jgi:hypothetical protein